ncbi:hypothetical protein D3C86_838140 [compost metagenome]
MVDHSHVTTVERFLTQWVGDSTHGDDRVDVVQLDVRHTVSLSTRRSSVEPRRPRTTGFLNPQLEAQVLAEVTAISYDQTSHSVDSTWSQVTRSCNERTSVFDLVRHDCRVSGEVDRQNVTSFNFGLTGRVATSEACSVDTRCRIHCDRDLSVTTITMLSYNRVRCATKRVEVNGCCATEQHAIGAYADHRNVHSPIEGDHRSESTRPCDGFDRNAHDLGRSRARHHRVAVGSLDLVTHVVDWVSRLNVSNVNTTEQTASLRTTEFLGSDALVLKASRVTDLGYNDLYKLTTDEIVMYG